MKLQGPILNKADPKVKYIVVILNHKDNKIPLFKREERIILERINF
jgi:uncharacterized protein (UPF0128 family)